MDHRSKRNTGYRVQKEFEGILRYFYKVDVEAFYEQPKSQCCFDLGAATEEEKRKRGMYECSIDRDYDCNKNPNFVLIVMKSRWRTSIL